jgi:anaerobic magnesium-protoporphyrin IX monomethyl ester cyclase
MAEILLTHSYMLDFDPKQKKIGQPYAPLGTLYALSILKENGVSVYFHDCTFLKRPDQIIPVLKRENPRIVVIYDDGFSFLTKMCLVNMRKTAIRIIELAHLFGAIVILCSSDANDNYGYYLENKADFVLIGESEITLKELAGRILTESGTTYKDIDGLAFKKDEELCLTNPRSIIDNLDSLPFPSWDLLDVEAYKRAWKSKNGFFTLNMVTTRGCPYNCVWCAKPIYGKNYNSRSPLNVVNEMVSLKKTLSPDRIWFADDIFGLNPGWIQEFALQIKLHNLQIPFSIQSRADLLLDYDQLNSLAGAGCRKIWLGIESGSQKILYLMQKGITVEQIRRVSPLIRKSGIEQAFFLQLGFPGETKDDIRETIRLLTDLMPDDIGISVTYPLPGTKFFNSVKNTMNVNSNWNDSDDLSLLFKSTFCPGYYKILHRYIHKFYRAKQSIYYLKEIYREPSSINHSRVRRIILFPWYLICSVIYKLLMNIKEHDGKKSL